MPFYELLPGGGMPAGLQAGMDSVLNKKWETSTTYPPEDWPGTVNLMGPLPERTVSGSVVAFSDGADAVLLKSCAVTIAPTLDGVSSVDVVHGGKNVFDITTYPITEKRYIRSSDGYFAISTRDLRGATEDYIPCVSMRGKTWVINKPNQTGNTVGLSFYDENKAFLSSVLTYPSGTNGVFTVPNNAYYFRFSVDLSSADDTEIQIEAGSTATAYEPYIEPTTHTANLGRTIYGGEVDVVNGTGTETHKQVILDGAESQVWQLFTVTEGTLFRLWIPNKATTTATNTLCSFYTPTTKAQRADGTVSGTGNNLDIIDNRFSSISDFTTWLESNNVTITYEIATPETFTFTPVPIITRLGDNTMWGDGDLSVTYRRDIDLALAQ